MINCGIIGTGKYIPSRKVDNKFVAGKTKTSKSWILKKQALNKDFLPQKKKLALTCLLEHHLKQ